MQPNTRRSVVRQWALCVFFPLFLFGAYALAQELPAPPELSAIDQHGVNLATGQFDLPGLDIGIGAEGSGLNRITNEKSDNHTNKLSFEVEPDVEGYGGWMAFYANLFGESHRFNVGYWSGSDGYVIFEDGGPTYTSFNGQGTITCTSDVTLYYRNGTCTLTLADGTVAVYGHSNGRSDKNGTWYVKTVTMPSGEVLSYTYYTSGSAVKAIKSVSSSLGWMLKYEVNADYKVVKVTAINTSEAYCDPEAASCSVSSSYPNATATINGNTTTIARNGETIVTYTKNNDVVTVTSPSGVVKTIQYDSNDRVDSVTVGNKTWLYDSTGSRTTVTNPDQTTYYYSKGKWGTGRVRTETGHTTDYSYNLRQNTGRLESINDGGVVTSYTYDDRGNTETVTVTDEVNSTSLETTYIFPPSCSNRKTCNKPTSVTYPDGRTTEYTYYSHGGIKTKTTYAEGNQPIQTRYYYTQYTPHIKNSSGTLVAQPKVWRLTKTSSCMTATGNGCVGTADERITTQSYTGNNVLPYQHTVKLGDGSLPQVTTSDYTTHGQVNWVDGPKSGSVDRSYLFYDSRGRTRGSIGTDPDGSGPRPRPARRITYTADGQVATSESGTVTATSASALDTMTVLAKATASYSSTTGLPTVTRRYEGSTLVALSQTAYDSRLRPLCQAERLNPSVYGSITSKSACTLGTAGPHGDDRITRYSYTDDSRVESVTKAYGTSVATKTFTRNYNSDGTLDSVLDANNNVTQYSYDGLRRLKGTCYAHPSNGGSTNWSDCTEIDYRSDGRIDSTTLRDGQNIAYSYDSLGRVNGKTGAVSESLLYNNFGQITTRTNNGVTEHYTYNALGWLRTHTQPVGTVEYGYDSHGKRETLTYPDGFVVTYGYNDGNELTSLTTSSGGGSVNFAYDDRGRRSQLSRSNGRNTSYGYDQGRLETLSHSGLNSIGLSYSAANQITLKVNTNAAYSHDPIEQARQTYVNDDLNRIESIDDTTLNYDDRGNLNQDTAGNQYHYNAKNLMTSATVSDASVSLSYNAGDRLLSVQKSGTSKTRFLYDGADLIAEYSSSGTLLRRYVHGPSVDEPLIWYEGFGTSNPRYLHADQQGSIIAVTSSSGSVLNINTYDAFGNRHSSNENYASRFAYTGQVWLKELGLYYYKARMYNAKLGRFMQTDPIGYQDGMNWYGYVHGDPVNRRDPTGLASRGEPGATPGPPVDMYVYGRRNDGSWCEGWACQDFLSDRFFAATEGGSSHYSRSAQETKINFIYETEGLEEFRAATGKYAELYAGILPPGEHNIHVYLENFQSDHMMSAPNAKTIWVSPNYAEYREGWIGAAIGHELVHVRDHLNPKLDMGTLHGRNSSEINAYGWMRRNAEAFGITLQEKTWIRNKASEYYR